jgi:hypothetical protein
MDTIVVTNETEKVIKGRYAGKDYVFPVGQSVALPEIAASHIFGFKQSDKTAALTRLGWMTNSEQLETAVEKLGLIKFGVEGDTKTSSNVGPLVNAGGAEGGDAPKSALSPKATRLKTGAEQII